MDVLQFLKTIVVVICLDVLWLLTVGRSGQRMIERIQGKPIHFRWLGGLPVYAAIAYLVMETTSYSKAFLCGASVYAIYDWTNYAVLDGYDAWFALADTAWGGVLFTAARYLASRF